MGGPAWGWASFHSSDELDELLGYAEAHGKPLVVLAGGSNVLVSDQGIDGLVVTPAASGYSFTSDATGATVRVDAGVRWDELVRAAVDRGYSGIEALSGIPGSVGAAPVQNIGAYGQELSDTLLELTVWDRRQRLLRNLSLSECGFGYRASRFKHADVDRFVILDITLRLSRMRPVLRYPELSGEIDVLSNDPAQAVRQVRDAVLAIRRRKSMVIDDPPGEDQRSVGSFFVNPVVSLAVAADVERRVLRPAGRMPRHTVDGGRVKLSAAWLIERAGFYRGWSDGAAGLSTAHTLAIVNRGGASASDIVRVARRIRARVRRQFGIALKPEPVFLGFDADATLLLG